VNSSKPNWTPGDWHASQYLDDGRWGIVTAPSSHSIYKENDSLILVGVKSDLSEADARLMAASKDLYAALETLISHFERICDDRKDRPVLDQGRAVLSRARGEKV
jgi:hypothetical protein